MPQRVRFKYVKSPGYQRHHVTGFWGMVSPDGQKLNIELFEDTHAIFNESVLITDLSTGNQTEEITPSDHHVDRYIHAGISIPIDRIPVIIEWMKGKYQEYLNGNSKPQKDGELN